MGTASESPEARVKTATPGPTQAYRSSWPVGAPHLTSNGKLCTTRLGLQVCSGRYRSSSQGEAWGRGEAERPPDEAGSLGEQSARKSLLTQLLFENDEDHRADPKSPEDLIPQPLVLA